MKEQTTLSRRERQIMDIVYQLKEVTVTQVLERLPDPPSYSAVRALLRVLENKGHLHHKQDGPRYVFSPTLSKETARQKALQHLRKTFFDGSTEEIVAALLDIAEDDLSDEDYQNLQDLIEKARKEGR
jgi:BlaI family transcriptional regulator, penicillinase repressor